MIDRLLIFGGTGDLAGRFLLPAIAELFAEGALPHSFQIVGTGQSGSSDDDFRRRVAERLDEHAKDVPPAARQQLLGRLRYGRVGIGTENAANDVRALLDDSSWALAGDAARPIAAYLALPPGLFVPAVRALGEVGLPHGSRIVVEKPFGESLEDARDLNRLLRDVTGDAGENAVFRADHVLGMATVQNLLGVRLANRIIEPLWNATHIEQVEIRWEETLALEDRAGYYDRNGALKDVMQNHMLQILALVAMEPPLTLNDRDLRDRKVEALRTVCPPPRHEMRQCTRRARYTAGRLAGTGDAADRDVPDYAAEDGVDPDRRTETFAEVALTLDSWRWAGTKFVLRAGKAMAERWKGVVIRFRPVPHLPFDAPIPAANELRIGLDGPEGLSLHLSGSRPGPPPELVPVVLGAELPAPELRAYGQVLRDVLEGRCTLSIRGDEAEEAWRIMTPVIQAWAADDVPLEEYPAGSAGPA
jgi:glucose-6-phosphate 1-dehydrogenase